MEIDINKQIIWILGAHNGENLRYLDGYDVFALEANPHIFPELKKACVEERILNKALAKVGGGTTKFYFSREISEWGTTEKSRVISGSRFTSFEEALVESITLEELTEIWPSPDVIIVDVEGSEVEAVVKPMLDKKDFFAKTIIVIELSKDNWETIFDSFSSYRNSFSIVINGKIDNISKVQRGSTSSIEEWVSKELARKNYPQEMDSATTRQFLEIWFEAKGRKFQFNFSAWVDLVIYR